MTTVTMQGLSIRAGITHSEPEPRRRGEPAAGAAHGPSPTLDRRSHEVLARALDKLATVPSEVEMLALEKQSDRLDRAVAHHVVRATGKVLTVEHRHKQEQLKNAMEAAANKSIWDTFKAVCQYVSAAAAAVGGVMTANPLLIAGACLIGASIAAKAAGEEKWAMGLGLAGAACTIIAPSSATSSIAATAVRGTRAVAGIGAGTATIASNAYGHEGEQAMAARLLAQSIIEGARSDQAEGIDRLKMLLQRDTRGTERCLETLQQQHQIAMTAVRA